MLAQDFQFHQDRWPLLDTIVLEKGEKKNDGGKLLRTF